jgi:hypothetical protein
MGTNFYKVIPYTEEEKIKIKDIYNRLADSLIESGEESWMIREELEDLSHHCIHLGKRSCGWQFLWNHNNGKYYDVNIDSIKEFLESPGPIMDEYGQKFTVEEFFEDEIKNFLWGNDERHNCNGASYYRNNPEEAYYHYSRYGSVNIRGEEYLWSGHGDFLVNGLRFADTTEFS